MSFVIFALFSLFALVSSQTTVDIPLNDPVTSSFNVQVRYYVPPYDIGSAQFKCIGSVISLRHILTAASCIWGTPPSDILLVVGSTTMDWKEDNGKLQLVEKIDIHPDYKNEQHLVANLGIITTNSPLNKEDFIPRSISPTGLTLDESYSMIGFLGLSENLQRTFISISSPNDTACKPRFAYFNTFTYCSNTVLDAEKCGGNTGSPVFAGTDSEEIQGIVINDNFCRGGQNGVTSFHSINAFRDWIREISGASRITSLTNFIAIVVTLVVRKLV